MLLGIIEPDAGRRTPARPRAAARGGEDRRLPARGARPLSGDDDARGDRLHGRAARPAARRRAQARPRSCSSENGLGDYVDKPIKSLSKGMAQTIQLFGTIVHQPKLVVLDEPFSGPRRDQPGPARASDPRRGGGGHDGHLLDPRHPPCRAAVRADRDHRRRPDPLRGPGQPRRATGCGRRSASRPRNAGRARGATRCRPTRARATASGSSSCPRPASSRC